MKKTLNYPEKIFVSFIFEKNEANDYTIKDFNYIIDVFRMVGYRYSGYDTLDMIYKYKISLIFEKDGN